MLVLQAWFYYFKIAFKKEIMWKHYLLLEALQFKKWGEKGVLSRFKKKKEKCRYSEFNIIPVELYFLLSYYWQREGKHWAI